MNASTAGKDSLVRRILTTPVGPRILPRWKIGPGAEEIIAGAALTDEAAAAVRDTVRRTRLWQSERADVAAELCAHFRDAIAGGVDAAGAVAAFGDRRAAAALIRRAKRRGRPLWWWGMRRGMQVAALAVVALALAYVFVTVRYFTGVPRISRNFVAELNAPVLAVPESERAWPRYREAALARTKMPGELQSLWGPVWPDDPRWPTLVEYVKANRGTVAVVHSAAQCARLGYVLTDEYDKEMWARYSPDFAKWEQKLAANPSLVEVRRDYVTTLQSAANFLIRHACVAAEEGDGATVERVIGDVLCVSRHAGQSPFVSGEYAALTIFNAALDLLDDVMLLYPALLDDAALTRLAHIIGTYQGGGTLRVDLRKAGVEVEDFLQRWYTDDGHGDGRLTPRGYLMVTQQLFTEERPLRLRDWLEPVTTVTALPGRAERRRSFNATIDAASAESELPLFKRPGDGARDAVIPSSGRMGGAFWLTPLRPEFFAASLRSAAVAAEQVSQHRDATLARMSLEIYKRRHGAYPASLSQLTPELLPAVPMDRYDGGEIKYALRDGVPLLYAVGTDRDDDGGRPPEGDLGNWRASRWMSVDALKALAHTKQGAALYDGDWVLWPPQRDVPDSDYGKPPPAAGKGK